jgi:transposase
MDEYHLGMDVDQLKDDVEQGRIDLARLVELLQSQQRLIDQLKKQLAASQARLDELEKGASSSSSTQKTDQPFSVDAEEKRRRDAKKSKAKRKKPRGAGRVSTAEKLNNCERTEKVYPDGCSPEECWLSHTRPIWQLEDGRAVRVAYEVYRASGDRYGKIPGAFGRSEFSLEIVLAIGYQVYVVGLSIDKVCLLMNFFQHLNLSKSQADALLNQLARRWEKEFDHLCTLLANSLVVHADETSWSINSVWAFLSEKARVILFGVHKDGHTLKQLLDSEVFAGLLISDNAAVYANFTHAQKCWAHLLRKAIKLTLLAPEIAAYRQLTDGLLAIYRKACKVQRDGRLGDAGREQNVADLDDEVVDLCGPMWAAECPKLEGHADDYRLLCNEVMNLMLKQELFRFVTAPAVRQPNGEVHPVSGTNNEAERGLRGSATARATGRTSKTVAGARRRSIITSVLESLRKYLKTTTLASLIAEVVSWERRGGSCFARATRRIAKSKHKTGILDAVLPQPSG